MKKTIVQVLIALYFAEMTVRDLIPFARSIHDNAGADPDVTVDPLLVTALDGQIIALSATVTLRETNKSKSLTTLEGRQATAVILTLTKIASSVEEQANDIIPGDTNRATLAIQRIGFSTKRPAFLPGRTFEVYKVEVGAAYVRVKRDPTVYLHHWRYSPDGINWVRLPDTKVVSIYVSGLPLEKDAYFQHGVTLKENSAARFDINDLEPDWSDSISRTIPRH